ncbi:MAG: ribosome recycling factor [Alphaproteobacteria bacterium]|nr:ribosome recycling factor [Alphaproteobacteria bacterium]
MAESELGEIRRRMQGALDVLKHELAGLRTGRASTALLEPVTVDAYGSAMPLNQVGTISVPEPRALTVQVWDRALVKAVEKAIRGAGLGLNPVVEGQVMRILIPELNAERRAELARVAHKYAEQSRIAVRNVRRDGMERLKRREKDGDITQDEHRHQGAEIQKATDQIIKEIDRTLATKEAEIKQV